MTGIEPATSGTTIRRSNQLSYTHHQSIELRLKAKGKAEPRKAGSGVGSAPLHLDPGCPLRRAQTNRPMVASSGAGYSSFGGGALSCTAVPRVRKTVANFLLVGMLVSMASCGPYRRSRGGGTNDLILRSEILQVPDRSAFTLIRLLRPRWLSARIQATPQNPTPAYAYIYVDNLQYGPIESLYDLSSNVIDRINFIGSLDATTLYGTGFMGGVIHVHTRRGG